MRKAIIHLKKTAPTLRAIIEKAGPYRIEFLEPVFSTLVRSIVFQQLSGNVARVIYKRLVDAAAPGGELTPEAILKLKPAKLRAIGLSKQKSAYILDLAQRTREGSVVFETIHQLSDEEVIEHLTAVERDCGWTGHMVPVFSVRPNHILS